MKFFAVRGGPLFSSLVMDYAPKEITRSGGVSGNRPLSRVFCGPGTCESSPALELNRFPPFSQSIRQ